MRGDGGCQDPLRAGEKFLNHPRFASNLDSWPNQDPRRPNQDPRRPNQDPTHQWPRLLSKAGEGGRGREAAAPARGGRRKAPRSSTRGEGGAARPAAQPRIARPGERRRCSACYSTSRTSTRGGGGEVRPTARPRPAELEQGSREGDAGNGDGDGDGERDTVKEASYLRSRTKREQLAMAWRERRASS
nr:unnamed protein product [Digitaria exilis]